MTADSTTNPESPDVIVIGAGLAGATAAMVLADAGRSVLMLERRSELVGAPRSDTAQEA